MDPDVVLDFVFALAIDFVCSAPGCLFCNELLHMNDRERPTVVPMQFATQTAQVAKAVVAYRDELKKAGYTNKTLKDDFELKDIEDRLDQLSESLLSPKRFVDPEEKSKWKNPNGPRVAPDPDCLDSLKGPKKATSFNGQPVDISMAIFSIHLLFLRTIF